MVSLQSLKPLVRDEITQRTEEGCDTTGFLERWENAESVDQLMALYHELMALPVRAEFPYVEPSDWDSICREREEGTRRFERPLSDAELLDRLHGAWLGRVAGCMLGKPVEGWSAEAIRSYLEGADAYPLQDYFPPLSRHAPESLPQPYTWCTKGNFQAGEVDDDTNYTILGLHLFEQFGPDFTTAQVGQTWLRLLPYHQVCTAERAAYRNLVNELPIEQVPLYLNPYREWIGARIRADFWGYCSPGQPERAAQFAFRDAALSHVKNGIYGEMMAAAMIATALVSHDIEGVIRTGAAQIPARSRLAEVVRDVLAWKRQGLTWQAAYEAVRTRYYWHYHWVHTNNNDAIVLIALLWGYPDFEQVITTAVMMGLDTDCNGATAGSICGAMLGARHLPEKWIAPLNDTLKSTVIGFPVVHLRELAERTLQCLS